MVDSETAPELSIIIASRNRREMLAECLQALQDTVREVSYETLLVDDASTDGTPQMVAERFPSVRVLSQKQPASWTVTNNLGIAQSRGAFLLLLNDDAKVLPETVDRIVAFMRQHPRAAVVTPVVRNADGTVQPTVRRFPNLRQAVAQSLDLHRLRPQNKLTSHYYGLDFDYSQTQQAPSVGTTCYLLRREAYDQVGVFDEGFPPNFSDLEFNWRLQETGWETWVLADVSVIHYGGGTMGLLNLHQLNQFHRGMLRMYRKHYAPRQCPAVNGMVYAGIGARYLYKVLLRLTGVDRLLNRLPQPHRRLEDDSNSL